MNYYKVIKNLYPEIKDEEFSLRDDGHGIYLERWDYSQPQPDLSSLEADAIAAEQEAQRNLKILEIKERAFKDITAVYPIHKQLNIMAEGTEEEKTAMRNFINQIRQRSNDEEAALD